jgi:hypothetical protein
LASSSRSTRRCRCVPRSPARMSRTRRDNECAVNGCDGKGRAPHWSIGGNSLLGFIASSIAPWMDVSLPRTDGAAARRRRPSPTAPGARDQTQPTSAQAQPARSSQLRIRVELPIRSRDTQHFRSAHRHAETWRDLEHVPAVCCQ